MLVLLHLRVDEVADEDVGISPTRASITYHSHSGPGTGSASSAIGSNCSGTGAGVGIAGEGAGRHARSRSGSTHVITPSYTTTHSTTAGSEKAQVLPSSSSSVPTVIGFCLNHGLRGPSTVRRAGEWMEFVASCLICASMLMESGVVRWVLCLLTQLKLLCI